MSAGTISEGLALIGVPLIGRTSSLTPSLNLLIILQSAAQRIPSVFLKFWHSSIITIVSFPKSMYCEILSMLSKFAITYLLWALSYVPYRSALSPKTKTSFLFSGLFLICANLSQISSPQIADIVLRQKMTTCFLWSCSARANEVNVFPRPWSKLRINPLNPRISVKERYDLTNSSWWGFNGLPANSFLRLVSSGSILGSIVSMFFKKVCFLIIFAARL